MAAEVDKLGIPADEAIRVFVRIRPLNKRELSENQVIGWQYTDTAMLEETPNGQRAYVYDRCFDTKVNNTFVYEIVGKRLVMKVTNRVRSKQRFLHHHLHSLSPLLFL